MNAVLESIEKILKIFKYKTYPVVTNDKYIAIFVILSIIFWMLYILKDLLKEIFSYKKIDFIKNENLFKVCLLIHIFFLSVKESYAYKKLIYVMGAIVLYKIYKERKTIKIGITPKYTIPLYLAMLLSSLNATYRGKVLGVTKRFFPAYIIPIFMNQYSYGKKFNEVLKKIFILSVLICVFLGFVESIGLIKGMYYPARISGIRGVWRYAGILMYGFIYFLYNLIMDKIDLKNKILNLYGLLITGYIIVLTQNRSTWAAICVVIFTMTIMRYYEKNKIKKGVIKILILILVSGLLVSKIENNKYMKRLYSIGNIKSDNSNTGRIELWQRSIRMFKESPLTGIGISKENFNAKEKIKEYKKLAKIYQNEAHSSYFHVLATTGIIGSLALFWMKLGLFLAFIKQKKTDVALYMLIGFSIMGGFVSTIIYRDMLGILLFFSSLALQQKEDKS